MRIRISVWKDNAQLGDDQWTTKDQSPKRVSHEADAIIDQWLNDIHAGKHGAGHFDIHADFVDTVGGIASFYGKLAVDYPPNPQYLNLAAGVAGIPPRAQKA
jgi:hypothetical protein